MITIKAEWKQMTKMGYTDCNADKTIFGHYRDVDTVEEAVAWVKKLFSNKDYSDQMVDFMFDNNTAYGCTVSRYFKDYSLGYSYVYFGGLGNGIKTHIEKITKKDIKESYLKCVEMCMKYEEEVKTNAE